LTPLQEGRRLQQQQLTMLPAWRLHLHQLPHPQLQLAL
jgi:hypothetical protein